MVKVYVENNARDVEQMFEEEDGYEVVKDIKEADLVCLIGGSDINPRLYLEENTRSLVNNAVDLESLIVLMQASRLGLPMVGICRGGQLLNVLAGGSMLQHVVGHTGQQEVYPCKGLCGRPVKVRMDHHQVMVPAKEGAKVLYNSQFSAPEVIIYEEFQTLCFQPHPEWSEHGDPARELFFSLLETLFTK